MTVLQRHSREERQQEALHRWGHRAGMTMLVASVALGTVLSALAFGRAVWLLALLTLVVAVIVRSVITLLRDDG